MPPPRPFAGLARAAIGIGLFFGVTAALIPWIIEWEARRRLLAVSGEEYVDELVERTMEDLRFGLLLTLLHSAACVLSGVLMWRGSRVGFRFWIVLAIVAIVLAAESIVIGSLATPAIVRICFWVTVLVISIAAGRKAEQTRAAA